MSEDLVIIGRIGRPHGVSGEVKIHLDEDLVDDLVDRIHWLVGFHVDSVLRQRAESVRTQHGRRGAVLLVRFGGVTSRTEADLLRGAHVFADRAEIASIREKRRAVPDLIGFEVVSVDGEPVGSVVDYRSMPAQNVIVAARAGKRDVLIPHVDAFVVEIRSEERLVVIRPIEGLLAD